MKPSILSLILIAIKKQKTYNLILLCGTGGIGVQPQIINVHLLQVWMAPRFRCVEKALRCECVQLTLLGWNWAESYIFLSVGICGYHYISKACPNESILSLGSQMYTPFFHVYVFVLTRGTGSTIILLAHGKLVSKNSGQIFWGQAGSTTHSEIGVSHPSIRLNSYLFFNGTCTIEEK